MRTLSAGLGRKLKQLVIAAALVATAAGFEAAAETQVPDEANAAKARAAIAALAASLKTSLGEALASGGPTNALSACQAIAPEATRNAAETHGLSIGRTALRVRNPANAPDAFERRVLEEFQSEIAKGADAAKLEHAEIVTKNGASTFRLMKPIVMAEKPCAACHGATIAPDVRSAIKSLYPEDAATGFAPGELRGAFTVSIPIQP
ncbi:Tll0287-like domain-containing protein [Hyphomicrobium sp. DMF-1]|jgi:hypothetical protein|uniref:Tll0287-like domain-containing protein n=1 Tax=Hyphomicrobium sp. DMF-1 TaxID=3019544 RepID=UPI0022EC0901|nr:DUF3365 domain-containing protein [Hyphomicrobium sp. DMF-1]WBT37890.1 DUF3365 domain-containing protein [Hyphomicrobium sp. DMF-1]